MPGPKAVRHGAGSPESLKPSSVGKDVPNPYSYEHRVSLNTGDMTKLGMDVPKVGDVFHVLGEGHVVSTDQSEAQNGDKAHNVSLQLKKMSIKPKTGGSMLDAVSGGVKAAQGE